MRYEIISTTDGKFVGDEIETNLITGILPSGEGIEFTNRLKTLDGIWKVWNSKYILEIKETEE